MRRIVMGWKIKFLEQSASFLMCFRKKILARWDLVGVLNDELEEILWTNQNDDVTHLQLTVCDVMLSFV